ncbi:retrovirus-related pol polyprotein from transposon TNT 1-94 [Tanacetum coccineum]
MKNVMEDEIQVIEKNNTWELTDRPSNKDVIGVKWVYKVKFNADGSVQRNKARLVAKGYSQQLEGCWTMYETFAPKFYRNGYSFRQSFHLQAKKKVEGKEEKVYKLKKALYGLKQAPRACTIIVQKSTFGDRIEDALMHATSFCETLLTVTREAQRTYSYYKAGRVTYRYGYYLVDGIYPELATLVKTISKPADDDHKRILYKQKQKSARKDVERAFGVLKKKWAILAANPTRALSPT